MAAPSSTVWGSVNTSSSNSSQGKLGVYVTTSNSNTQTTVNVDIWFWSLWSISDSANSFTCSIGGNSKTFSNVSIKLSNSYNSFNTNNQVKIGSYSYTFNRGTSSDSKTVKATYSTLEWGGGSGSVSTTVTIPAKPTYTISYNANGGSGAPASQTKAYGTTLVLSSSKPTRTGYTFKNWNTSSDGTGTTYSSGGNYTANAAATLYAQWTANTYTVSYNANGGSGAPASQTKTYGTTLTLSSAKPTKTGYTFVSWNTKQDGSGTVYSSGGSYTKEEGVTLYAQWKAVTYTITYNANGGELTPTAQTKEHGVDIVIEALSARTGYTFLGWATSSTATSATYSIGSVYTDDKSVTLYAVWTKSASIQTIKARYQRADGSWGDYGTVYSASINVGNTCSWQFAATDEYEAASVSYTVSAADTIKYVDVKRKQYTLGLVPNGGVCAVSNITFYYGSTVQLKKRPTRSGYTFLGWSSSSGSGPVDYEMNAVFNTEGTQKNTMLHAVWDRRYQNVYLYDSGESYACEYIEDAMGGFGENGAVFAGTVLEKAIQNNAFSIGSEYIASVIAEGAFDKGYLTDDNENILTDENGNKLFCFIDSGNAISSLLDVDLLDDFVLD